MISGRDRQIPSFCAWTDWPYEVVWHEPAAYAVEGEKASSRSPIPEILSRQWLKDELKAPGKVETGDPLPILPVGSS
jgi:hypothetical protein